MTELHGTGIAAMLTADAKLNPRAGLPTSDDGLFHQSAYSLSIEHSKWVRLKNVRRSIKIDELRGIVAGETERGLGEIVRPE
jgi:hypothetical protein